MKEYLIYENHLGEKIDFKNNKYLYVSENDMRDFAWNYSGDNDIISGFNRRGVVTKALPVTVAAPVAVADSVKNSLFEITQKDVLAHQNGNKDAAGKIWCGGYYLKCFVVGSSKSTYLSTKRITQFALNLATDEPVWIKKVTQDIIPIERSGGVDFPFDFPIDMANSFTQSIINNKFFQPVNFRIEINAVDNEINSPAVIIGDNIYHVDVTIQRGHKLVIDSFTGEVYLENEYGERTTVYHYRDRDYNIFAKIGSGEQPVSWVNELSFPFKLTLYYERSEPEWS